MQIIRISKGGLLSGRAGREVDSLAERIDVAEGTIVLPERVEADYGTFKAATSVLFGPKIGNSRGQGSNYYTSGWLFNTSRKFVEMRRVEGNELPIEPARYRVEIDVPGSGLMELPGYRLKNGVLLLYVTPRYEFNFPNGVLSAGGLEDYAGLSINPLENGFEGELSVGLTKADYASLSILGTLVEDQVFFGSESGKVEYRFLAEPLLLVSHEKILDVRKLQKALDVVSMVSGHGNFELKLEVGKAVEKMEFSVSLKEEEN